MGFLASCVGVLCLVFHLVLVKVLNFIARLPSYGSPPPAGCRLPPGPVPLPVIGNLLDLGDKPHKSLSNLAKIHGPIMRLKLGQLTTVVISSSTLAKEVLQKQDLTFCNRMVIDAVRALQHHESGVPWIPVDAKWRNLRKVCNSYIFASHRLDANESLRSKKVQALLAKVEEGCRLGGAVDIGQAVFGTILNAMSNTIFSLDLTDGCSVDARELKTHIRGIMEEAGKPNLADYFPLLRKIDLQGIRRQMTIHFGKLLNLFDRIIDERMKLREAKGYIPCNDMLDTLLSITEEDGEKMERSEMKHLFLVLFVAGSDTTASTLEWAMAELLRNPKVLSRARAELEQTIGRGNLLEESAIARLSYLQAVIKETLRLHPAVPLLLPRKAGANAEVQGFHVPKDAQVLVNVWAIGRDPTIWKEPNLFKPERFLESDIDARGQNFELIPFGAGRRICPGLPLAIRFLHLILGSLIQSFDWKLEDGVTPDSMNMEEKFGISLQRAQPLRACPLRI